MWPLCRARSLKSMALEAQANGAAAETLDLVRLDAFVDRARRAAEAFRRLDQEAVDRIVREMVVAGLENAFELARLAMEETGFGVLEDKVVKNFIATEFLYDYLDGKRSVGVIEEDAERGIQYVAEPIGVVLALLPITNPTSTALFKAIVAAKTRNAIVFRPSARAARCAMRAIELMQDAGERAGRPPDALQVIPDPTLDVSQYLFHHEGIDLMWTTGGPKAVAAANAAGKPTLSVGAGNAPVYIHRSADIRMAVVDMLISKTFDSSVICPAEQTCVVDDEIYDEFADWVKAHHTSLEPLPSAFFSVSLTAAEDTDEARAATRQCIDELLDDTGWTPTRATAVAGALQYREYDIFTRTLIRLMMRRAGHTTDITQDHEYTDWGAVERFGREFAGLVR